MKKKYPRDMVGYGQKLPKVKWPNNAKLALQIVLNYEEGSENCVLHGDKTSEVFLSEIIGAQPVKGRHINMESLYEYGSRRGFWRIHELFQEKKIPIAERKKISLFCNVDIENVIETIDVRTIYEAPISFHKEKLDDRVLSYFKIKNKKLPNLTKWKNITSKVLGSRKDVNIGIVGKYVNLKDAYKSLDEALVHGGISNNLKVNLTRIDSENLKVQNIKSLLKEVSGVLIPGGFGKRGSEGKIAAIKYARLNRIPFFGICFGMQMAIIEAARNLLNIKNASTSEFGNNCTPVVGLLEEWQKGKKMFKGSEKNLGGTMRLGLYDAILKNNSLISKIYSLKKIRERHRHRYEVNIKYKDKFEKKGLIFSALSPDGMLPEIIELKNHPWFVGVQFHPEFKSRPFTPHPLFSSFVKAAEINKERN